jgi:hypothetical protein
MEIYTFPKNCFFCKDLEHDLKYTHVYLKILFGIFSMSGKE